MICGYSMHFFGLLGSHNDINVLERFNVFANLAEGSALLVNYSINGYGLKIIQWDTISQMVYIPHGQHS